MSSLSWLVICVVATLCGITLGFLFGIIFEQHEAQEDEDE